ncbi:MAG: chorismate synthase [Candidatus Hydrogenedentes bacterium]|nr:chorismate synthase [Candidatus Hydrogenedentota bacterium]
MLGCSYGKLFQTTVAGGSYQEGLTVHLQGVPPGLHITEAEIYASLLTRKPGQSELASPRREPDVPVIYSGVNAADTMPGFANGAHTNGTPLVILIPNLDRHFEHIEQYQSTNRTPRPGHASYASYVKYGEWDDSIGAGFFSGRYTSTIVAAGAVARHILKQHGIEVFAYVKEAAGISAGEVTLDTARKMVDQFRRVRRDYDPIYNWIFNDKRFTEDMRFLEKMAVLAELEKQLIAIQDAARPLDAHAIRAEYGIHPTVNCPDVDAAFEMEKRILEIRDEGDSSGGLVEVVATGLPVGMGEPVFQKLDGELGRMMSIGTIKAVEIGAGYAVKNMRGSEDNDQIRAKDGKVYFESNHAGGVTGGLSNGQPLVLRLAVKPTPTIAKDQRTIDKVSLENAVLSAVTRRDPTIVARVWPVAEAFTALILLDQYMQHLSYRALWVQDRP